MSQSIPDIEVGPVWKDVLAEAVQLDPTFPIERLVLCAKGTWLLVWFGDNPPSTDPSSPENKYGEPMTIFEKLVIVNEPKIWVRTFLSNSNSRVHLAQEL